MIHAYLDGELSRQEQVKFESRLTQEPALATALEGERHFRRGFRKHVRQTTAPASLRRAVEAALTTAPPPLATRGQRLWQWLTRPQTFQPATALAIVAVWSILLSTGVWWLSQPAGPVENHSVFRQLAGKHGVYLQREPVDTDITGSPSEIRQWFASRLPFSVTVPTLSGWQLEGGRLGEFHHLGTAHLVYDDGSRHISLTLFAARESDFPADSKQIIQGKKFFVGQDDHRVAILWRVGEVGYALVGDPGISAAELLPLAIALRS